MCVGRSGGLVFAMVSLRGFSPLVGENLIPKFIAFLVHSTSVEAWKINMSKASSDVWIMLLHVVVLVFAVMSDHNPEDLATFVTLMCSTISCGID